MMPQNHQIIDPPGALSISLIPEASFMVLEDPKPKEVKELRKDTEPIPEPEQGEPTASDSHRSVSPA